MTEPPGSLNLMALEIRFSSTSWIRCSSAWMAGKFGDRSVASTTEALAASTCCDSMAVSTTSTTSTRPAVDGEAAALDGVDLEQVADQAVGALHAAHDALEVADLRRGR